MIPESTAHKLHEVGGGIATMASELERIGYLGRTPCSYKEMPMAAHFELHIEQGPRLENSNKKIGIVTGVNSYRWFTVNVSGQDAHTGTTDFSSRADALLTASKLILHSHRLATANGALASTGLLTLKPGSTNTIPGLVSFSLDMRAPTDEIVDAMTKKVHEDFPRIAAGENLLDSNSHCTPGIPCKVHVTQNTDSPAVQFHPDCISVVRDAAKSTLGPDAESLMEEMVSGAGHDTVYTSKRCPSSMIFVPCKGGISHNPAEFTSPEDCALGAQVLLQSVLRFDKMRAERRITWKQEGYTI
jgi:hydantoinase/carbamoylase family amidase